MALQLASSSGAQPVSGQQDASHNALGTPGSAAHGLGSQVSWPLAVWNMQRYCNICKQSVRSGSITHKQTDCWLTRVALVTVGAGGTRQ